MARDGSRYGWNPSITDIVDSSIPTDDEIKSAVDEVLYVDDELYAALGTATQEENGRALSRHPVERPLLDAIEAFLYHEAELLDDRRYEEWLDLFTPNCIYWVPADIDVENPRNTCSINFDDHRRLTDRIALIRTGHLHSQTPASRTCRTVSNVHGHKQPNGSLHVRAKVVIWEYRRRRLTPFVASTQLRLDPHGGDGWRIRWKVIKLLDCDEAQGNITFIL